jgi:hypothetical protein
MLLHPTTVQFGDLGLDGVVGLTIDRLAAREIVEFDDAGPHAAFADVSEVRTMITLTRRLTQATLDTPMPGMMAELSFTSASGSHDAGRARVWAIAVLREARHALADGGGRGGASAMQTLTFIAVSDDGGATDPVHVEPL